MASSFTRVGQLTYMTVDAVFTGHEVGLQIAITGATSAGNNGVYRIKALSGDNSLAYDCETGVTEPFADGTHWQVDPLRAGHPESYLSRGYRMGGPPPTSTFIVILPYPTTAAQETTITEMLKLKKGAGIKLLVERRLSPGPLVDNAPQQSSTPVHRPWPAWVSPRRFPWWPDPADGLWP